MTAWTVNLVERHLTVKFTMVGARFLEADFMRINLACEPYCLAYTPFLHSHKGRIGEVHRDRDAGWRRRGRREPRDERAPEAPWGTFRFQIFIKASSPEIWSETVSGSEDVLVRK